MTYEEITKYFKFYRYNEDILQESENYLFIDVQNKDSFSFCYSNLLMNICSDFESLCKKYFNISGNVNIGQLISRFKCDPAFANFLSEKISLMGTSYTDLEPLVPINDNTFFWWMSNNDIKHDKLNNISAATQWNIVNALAALYALNMYIMHKVALLENQPDVFLRYNPIFSLSNLKPNARFVGGDAIVIEDEKVEEMFGNGKE